MIPAPDCFDPVTLRSRGADLRAAHFAAVPQTAPRGLCVLLGGQTEYIEKYFDVIDELRGRGFGVVTMDWRGQGGSQRLIADAPLKAHVRDFCDYDADLAVLMAQMVMPKLASGERPIGLAHSMGGHILLRYLHAHPERFKACILSAPMVRFSTGALPLWLVRAVSAAMKGRGEDFIWGSGAREPLTLPFEKQIITSDRARFMRSQNFLKSQPQLRLGGPTWSWLNAALASVDEMAAPEFAKAITTPVLIVGAGHDRVCLSPAAKQFAAALPRGVYVEIAGAEHEILMERDIFRGQFWQAFDRFLA